MKERGMLYAAPMVRALLGGTKTQTRRLMNPQPIQSIMEEGPWRALVGATADGILPEEAGGERRIGWTWRGTRIMPWPHALRNMSPYGVPGDRLWVRETWFPDPPINGWPGDFEWNGCGRPISGVPEQYRSRKHVLYAATRDCSDLRCRPGIHMPRWASRITLEVTEVRVQRLGDISEADAKAEGAMFHDGHGTGHTGWRHDVNHGFVYATARESFFALWKEINGAESLAANPWVWAVSFTKYDKTKETE